MLETLNQVPSRVVADHGGEANLIAFAQIELRRGHRDQHAGRNSMIRTKSIYNIRIERFWLVRRVDVGGACFVLVFLVLSPCP